MSGRDVVRDMRESGSLGRPARRPGISLDLVLGVVAAIAIAVCLYVGAGWLQRPPLLSGPPPPAVLTASVENPVFWTTADTTRCQADGRAAALEGVPAEFGLANRTLTDGGFAYLATQVSCRATTKIKRLCNAEQKAEFVAAVNDYVTRLDLITGALALEGAPMAIIGEFTGGEVAMGSAMYQDERTDTLGYLDINHARVIKGLRALARANLVTTSDFGGFMGVGVSGTIVAALSGVKPDRSVCT